MDGDRFDRLSRSLAERSSRRQAIRRLGAGGVAGGVLSALGFRAARAQEDEIRTCRLELEATVAIGPNRRTIYAGELTLEIDPEGAIDQGTLVTEAGDTYDLVGQAIGRALNLRITVGDGQVLALTGTGQQDIVLCRGSISGTFGGPEVGDLGTWTAVRRRRQATPTPTSGAGTGGESGGTAGGGSDSGGTGGGSGGPTPTPCPPQDCGPTFVLNPATCTCDCPPPYDRCGDICCFGGAICTDPGSGSCSCPPGTEPCNEVCTPSCPSGQYFDASCQCTAQTSCGAGETLCNGMCVSTSCQPYQLFDGATCQCVNRCSPGQGYCGGVCIDIVNDAANCGACGNVCPTGVPCIAGTCTCPPGYKYCAGTGCKPESSTC